MPLSLWSRAQNLEPGKAVQLLCDVPSPKAVGRGREARWICVCQGLTWDCNTSSIAVLKAGFFYLVCKSQSTHWVKISVFIMILQKRVPGHPTSTPSRKQAKPCAQNTSHERISDSLPALYITESQTHVLIFIQLILSRWSYIYT